MRVLCRFLLALSLVLIASAVHAAAPPTLKQGERWLVLASRQDADDATNLARLYGRDLAAVHVVRARNGWHAVIAGPFTGRTKAEVEARLPDTVNVPRDAYLGGNDGFQELMFTAPRPAVTMTIRFDGKTLVSREVSGITLVLDSTPAEQEMRVARMIGRAGPKVLFSTSFADYPSATPEALARVVRLDPGTPAPQFVFTLYSGGAHCCTATRIATQDPAGAWHVRDVAAVDGGGHGLEDVDGDRHVELLGVDNSFLYAFAAYAESWAPPVVLRLSGGQLRDVTREASIRPYLRRELREMELEATVTPALWTEKGFLAGWVGAKSRLGEVDDAWRRVAALPERADLFSAEACAVKMALRDCPADKRRTVGFAEGLRLHLSHHDYPVPKLGNP